MTEREGKAKTRKDRRREQEILNMPEDELLRYIEQCQKSIEAIEKQKEIAREVLKLGFKGKK